MANIQPRKNKNGKITSYTIRVFRGKDSSGKNLKPHTTSFKPNPNWSQAKTEKELQKFVVLFENECKNGFVVDNKQTFSQYAEYVINLKLNVEHKKHSTIQFYKGLLDRINLAIGHIKLTDIRPQHLNLFYEMLGQNGANLKTGGQLSAKTIVEHHRLIHTILKQAEKEMLVPYNAASKATPPVCKRKEARFIDVEDIKNILFYLKNEPLKWQVAMTLLIYTGCRRGEIAGLKIKNIDYKNCIIRIENNLLYAKDKGIYEDTPKTFSSIRSIKVPEKIMCLVKKLAAHNQMNILKLGSKWADSGYLLTQDNGLPMHPDSITDYCSKFAEKYNKIIREQNKKLPGRKQLKEIPHVNPHAFRHSQASILFFEGLDAVTISKRLGHASVSTTTDIYSHIIKKADETASSKLDKILKSEQV